MESLTHASALKTLIILLKNKRRMTVKEIADAMGEPHGDAVHAINILEEGNLVESRVDRTLYERGVVLTPVGFTVAEKIKEIEELIGWMGREGVK